MQTKSLLKTMATLLILALLSLPSCKSDEMEPEPEPTCATTNVSYAQVIVPILEQKCYQCHKGDNPIGGFTFDTYETLKSSSIDTDKLKGTIARETGFAAMPPAAALDECALSQINAWVDQGAMNN